VHRLIWALVHDHWPTAEIDHRNGLGGANQLANLREATQAQNAQNLPPSPTRGTYLHVFGRYGARIKVNRKQVSLGYFDTVEEAHAAYLKAKSELHTFQPVPRDIVICA
jgi:HNH endonuclease/AP2 domain